MTTLINADFTTGSAGANLSAFTDTTGNAWAKDSFSVFDSDFLFFSDSGTVRLRSSGVAGHIADYYANVTIASTSYQAIIELIVKGTSSTGDIGLIVQKQGTGDTGWLELRYIPSASQVQTNYWLAGLSQTAVNTTSLTVSAGNKVWLRFLRSGTTATTYYSTSSAAGPWTTCASSFTIPTALQPDGKAGLFGYNGTGTTNTDIAADSLTLSTVSALGVTAATQSARQGAVVIAATATGGSGSFASYAWYRSTTTHFDLVPPTGTTTLAGTGATLTDATAVNGQVYWYWCQVTDSLGATALSAEVSGVIADKPPLCLLCIGTSWTSRVPSGGSAPPTWFATYLANLYGYRTVTSVNQGVGGSKTDDWLTSSTNLTAALAAGATAYAAMPSGTQKFVHFEHGFNDASSDLLNSDATFRAHCVDIFATLVANGWKVIFPYPSFSHNTGQGGPTETAANRDAGNVLRKAYQATVDALTDNVNVFKGSTYVYDYVGANPSLTTDDNNVHPTATGSELISQAWAQGIAAAVDRANGITGAGSFPVMGSSFIRGL